MLKKPIAVLVVGMASMTMVQTASAAGCGGYVSVWVSGCAPWDNNPRRMPGAPGYVAPRVAAPVAPPSVATRFATPSTGNALISDNRGGVIPRSGGGLTSVNHNSLVSDRGGALRR